MVRSATREPLNDDDIRDLLARSTRVVIARGKARRRLVPTEVDLSALKGPTGKYRAPMALNDEGTLLVGFVPEAFEPA